MDNIWQVFLARFIGLPPPAAKKKKRETNSSFHSTYVYGDGGKKSFSMMMTFLCKLPTPPLPHNICEKRIQRKREGIKISEVRRVLEMECVE